jgi:hypothetical protein
LVRESLNDEPVDWRSSYGEVDDFKEQQSGEPAILRIILKDSKELIFDCAERSNC